MRLCLTLRSMMLALPLATLSAVEAPKTATPAPAPSPAPAVSPLATPAPATKPRVRFETNFGAFVVELEPQVAPITVQNFLTYVKEGFYSGTIFHRVIPGFISQAGLGEDMQDKAGQHAPIFNEAKLAFQAGLKNTVGTIAMARTENPQSAMAQFYVNMGENGKAFDPHEGADGAGYCVFGHVVEGMEVLTKIEKVQTVWRRGMPNVPEYAVRIKKAELLPTQASTPAAAAPSTPPPVASKP